MVLEGKFEEVVVVEDEVAELVHDLFAESWSRELQGALGFQGEFSSVGAHGLESGQI